MKAEPHCWIVFVATTKAGRPAVHPWQVRERDGTPEGSFRSACKTEAAAAEICEFLNDSYARGGRRG